MNTGYGFILITAAVLLTSAIAIGITTAPFQSAEALPERCVSIDIIKDTDIDNTMTCIIPGDKTTKEQVKEEAQAEKEWCKEQKQQGAVDKCSSSQTNFGGIKNLPK
jgi:hypothetical protein